MIIPVRCFTCGKVLADKWNAYKRRLEELEQEKEPEPQEAAPSAAEAGVHASFQRGFKGRVLDELGLKRMCCRRHMLTHVDIVDIL